MGYSPEANNQHIALLGKIALTHNNN